METNSYTSWGLETATFRFGAQCLGHLRYACPSVGFSQRTVPTATTLGLGVMFSRSPLDELWMEPGSQWEAALKTRFLRQPAINESKKAGSAGCWPVCVSSCMSTHPSSVHPSIHPSATNKWFRQYATSRKVAGSRSDVANAFFQFFNSIFPAALSL
jgi:hypothetical protein